MILFKKDNIYWNRKDLIIEIWIPIKEEWFLICRVKIWKKKDRILKI